MASSTRKEREKQVRRQEILEAARAVIAAKGLSGATMEEIADKADYKPATLYLYFGSKDDLLASLYLSAMQFVVDEIEALAQQPEPDPLQKLKKLPDLLSRVYRFDPAVLMSLFYMQAGKGYSNIAADTLEQLNQLAQRGIRGLAGVFADGIARGRLEMLSPIVLADTVWSLFAGVVLWEESKRFFDPSKDHVESTLRAAMGLLFKGMTKDCAG
ncbi:MAG: TetR/AcrR family transcriptional regulator [Desulfarculus sp.]|jgi:AcrR family transcriptional regulator|nr:MAG: TetR/AcrR family transcriptional regulator [Desulfarculus sp.]